MSRSRFFDEMQKIAISSSTDKEKMVARVYDKGIQLYFKGTEITHPFKCDGYIESKTDKGGFVRMIIEYKDNKDFSQKANKARVIVQVLYYVKRFELEGLRLPNVILVGDLDECFVFHMNDILSYLDWNVDWSIAPSDAPKHNAELVMALVNDENIKPFVFRVNENFSFKDVAERIIDLANNVQRFVHVTEHNIAKIYEYFTTEVVCDIKSVSANSIVSIFIGVIKGNADYYLHPAKRNMLVTPIGEIKVKSDGYSSFIEYFKRTYNPQEQMVFDSIADRLIEDTKRRKDGEFYTPTRFVDMAHEMISSVFGEEWKETFVVWDNCCGTKNLTRDYTFKELYTSSLYQADLEIGKRYNRNSQAFVFDFLNDYIPLPDDLLKSESKLPNSLIEAFEQDKPILFFINPPYVTPNNMEKDGTSKKDVANTPILKLMKSDGMGRSGNNIQHQFIYRIIDLKRKYNLTKCALCLFSKPIYLSSSENSKLLDMLCDNFKFEKGILFNAGCFTDVSARWGITFNIWTSGYTTERNYFPHCIIGLEGDALKEKGIKEIYNINGVASSSDWVKEPVKKLATHDAPQLSSALICKEGHGCCGSLADKALGYYVNVANNVYKSTTDVYIVSSCSSMGHGCSIMPENFFRVCANFTARKAIAADWTNDKDEFMIPNTNHPLFTQFLNDSVVYSIFNTSSNQSSLRQIHYKGKPYNIYNEFFFMGKAEIEELANLENNDECYYDAHSDKDRYVYNLLKTIQLSPEAQAVLDKAVELTKASFKYRPVFNDEHPDYQINNWDCGWYQIKALVKQFMPDRLTEFSALYKALGEHLRPMVYELGFLRK